MNSEETKKLIIKSFSEKKNSHAFLFVTNNIERCYKDVIDIVKKINCKSNSDSECSCNICTTIDSNTNPDVISVIPEGKEIKTDQVVEIIKRFSTKPFISIYSSYIIVSADKMNTESANKLLKFLEEPEGNIIGFYITDRLNSVIPTIRSRCEIYNYKFGSDNILDILEISEDDYASYYNFCIDLITKLNDCPKYILMSETKEIAKKDRNEIFAIFNIIRKIYVVKYENITLGKYNEYEFMESLLTNIYTSDLKIIVKRINILDNIINDFKYNVNVELFINKFFLSWE